MEQLLADQLKELWQRVEEKKLLTEQFNIEQERGLAKYRKIWTDALLVLGHEDLQESLLDELGLYMKCQDLAEMRRRCESAVENLAREWREKVDPRDRRSVEHFYNETETEIYELLWWHTLSEDISPLCYVTALQFALRHGCRSCLDFGAGVGSGSILFARHGLKVGLADISSPLLAFSLWRLELRRLPARFFDLKVCGLPRDSFDMVTAMDVFEHLADPVEGVERLWTVLKPGGFLFGRFGDEPNEDRPLHVVQDFEPTFRRLRELGFVQVWQDEWLWGHQVYQKATTGRESHR
jgi:SAM-dependent methyltransferase